MTTRLQVYETPEITVTFDPALCIHSGSACVACPWCSREPETLGETRGRCG